MKPVKLSILIAFLLMTAGVLSAQEYKIAVQNPKETRVIIKDFSGELPIEGYTGNEIVITSTSGKFEIPEKAKGLKPVFPGGTDNTGIGLDISKTDNTITISCLLPFTRRSDYKIRLPEDVAVELTSGCERSNSVSVKGMKSELDIQTCHNIDLTDVTGPLVLSTISGNITIVYGKINAAKSSSISSISGDIDITLPSKTPLDLEMNTISGSIFSDFDFDDSKKDLKKVGGNAFNHTLNGGGSKYSISSISGAIFLRKGK
jgi:lia operon protein LiaG